MSQSTPVQQPMQAHLSNSNNSNTSSQIVSEQPTRKLSMGLELSVPASEEPKVSMRGGGCIGDCWDAFVCFECCKGICDCCC